jgi:adenylosuccinate synthase
MGTLHVVVGGQYGSEAKGHVTGYLAKHENTGAVVRVAGPNAGHTAYDDQGRRWALRQVPIAAVTNLECELLISAGSEIDPLVLREEVEALETAGIPVVDRLLIDPTATVIEEKHRTAEGDAGLTRNIGSTGKGIGAARSDRIMRTARVWGDGDLIPHLMSPVDVAMAIRAHLHRQNDVIIEGTQGYGLGLHAHDYPWCTSSDCRAIDFLAMVGISPWTDVPGTPYDHPIELAIWPVFRTYPIRVAGNSGPLYMETSWEELAERTGGHIQPEQTTVTGKTRRVGEWDPGLARAAMVANGAPSHALRPVLTFLDYRFPELANQRRFPSGADAIWGYLADRAADIGMPFHMVGTGPDTMIEI